jgi:1-acyl-sn-glycerol-3-phosphate acyltransferase
MLSTMTYVAIYGLVSLFRRLWWNWDIAGLENIPTKSKGLVVASNHLDWTDVYILAVSFPLSYRLTWIAKIEAFSNEFVARFLKGMNVIPLHRGEADRQAYVAAKTALENGAALVVFPEGHRSRTGGLIEARTGAVRLAVRTGCPILPIALWGTEKGFKGAMLRNPIHVKIGTPYYPSLEFSDVRLRWEQLTDDLMGRIAALLPEEYRGIYLNPPTRVESTP